MHITYTSIRDLQFASTGSNIVNMFVKFNHLPEEVPFSAYEHDTEPHGRELWQRAIQGDFGHIAEYVPPPPLTYEQMAEQVRYERDTKLKETDWTQLPDVPIATKEMWQPYRQALRDITLQEGFPYNVIWPTPPN